MLQEFLTMIYELRFYSVAPGRMADVHARFRLHLPALFQRHGVNCVGRWTALAGPNAPRFVYLLAYRDYAHRESAWDGFYADPEWRRVRAETNAGQEMVERVDLMFLKPNAAWRAPADPAALCSGVHEMVLQQVPPGQAAQVNAFLADAWLPAVAEAGGTLLGAFDMASGADMQKLVLLHAWPDVAAWHAGRSRIEADPGLRAQWTEQRRQLGTTLFLRSEVNLLEPPADQPVRVGLGRSSG